MAIPQHAKHSGRKIITRSKTTVRTIMKPIDGGLIRGYESTIQAKWALCLYWDRSLAEINEETEVLEIEHDGCVFKYYPDFEVVFDNGSIDYIEVKPFRRSKKPDVVERHGIIREHLKKQKYGFQVLTEQGLPQNNAVISNMRRLKWFALNSSVHIEALADLVPSQPATFGELTKRCGSPQRVMEMLGKQLAFVDLNNPIVNSTLVRKIEENDYVGSY